MIILVCNFVIKLLFLGITFGKVIANGTKEEFTANLVPHFVDNTTNPYYKRKICKSYP
jgi:hypothetical protein